MKYEMKIGMSGLEILQKLYTIIVEWSCAVTEWHNDAVKSILFELAMPQAQEITNACSK